MSEYAKNIQTIEDLWKKRIKLREEGCGRMSEYIYGTDSHEGHWLTGEEIVRCRDCMNKQPYDEPMGCDCLCGLFWIEVEPDGFCAWGERREQ